MQSKHILALSTVGGIILLFLLVAALRSPRPISPASLAEPQAQAPITEHTIPLELSFALDEQGFGFRYPGTWWHYPIASGVALLNYDPNADYLPSTAMGLDIVRLDKDPEVAFDAWLDTYLRTKFDPSKARENGTLLSTDLLSLECCRAYAITLKARSPAESRAYGIYLEHADPRSVLAIGIKGGAPDTPALLAILNSIATWSH